MIKLLLCVVLDEEQQVVGRCSSCLGHGLYPRSVCCVLGGVAEAGSGGGSSCHPSPCLWLHQKQGGNRV